MHVRTAHAVSIAVGLLLVWAAALLLLAGIHPAAVKADPACYWANLSGTAVPTEQVGPICHDFGTATGCNFPDAGLDPSIEVTAEACVPD